MGDNDDVILVRAATGAECAEVAFERARYILGTVPKVTLISATQEDGEWVAYYHYEPMFPLANPHPEW